MSSTATPIRERAPRSERRRRLTRRAAPLGLVALALAGSGVALVRAPESEGERAVARFAAAWERGDYPAMYRELSPGARERYSRTDVTRAHRAAAATATLRSIEALGLRRRGDVVHLDVVARTRIFGTVRGRLPVPVAEDGVAWAPHLVFPALRRGARLERTTQAPPRASILARDGRTLVFGPATARQARLGVVGRSIAGTLGPTPDARSRRYRYALGFPPATPTGLSGLERALERRVAGTPGGVLMAGGSILGSSAPRAAPAVRSTIDVGVQRAAVTALAGRLGGVAAIDAVTAEVRALGGLAFSAPQPPGSTFKIVTATAVLERGIARPSTRFPIETKAVIEGVDLENAHGEACGGTLTRSFALSCNSVWAPLGVQVGAPALVDTARRYGWDEPPALPGARSGTLPDAAAIGGPLALGSTAIGQGRVLATPLGVAVVAHTVASGGRRRPPSLVESSRRPAAVQVTTPAVARAIERMMVSVVEEGTGRAAAIDGVRVAGKTGTAELEDTTDDPDDVPEPVAQPPGYDTDAWFTAYAPVRRPRLAVAVLLVRAGAGGDSAAPVARAVLKAGL